MPEMLKVIAEPLTPFSCIGAISMMFGAEVKKGLTTIRVVGIIIFTHGEPHRPRPERQALRQTGTLNPRPDRVRDELFSDSDFFDPNDVLQVKYEMLRRVRRDDFTVRQAAKVFGFSRPSFYQAQEAFTRGGLGALVPQKRGPRRAQKLSPKVVEFVEQTIAADPRADLVGAVQQRFAISVHRRSIERALARAKKKDASHDRT